MHKENTQRCRSSCPVHYALGTEPIALIGGMLDEIKGRKRQKLPSVCFEQWSSCQSNVLRGRSGEGVKEKMTGERKRGITRKQEWCFRTFSFAAALNIHLNSWEAESSDSRRVRLESASVHIYIRAMSLLSCCVLVCVYVVYVCECCMCLCVWWV